MDFEDSVGDRLESMLLDTTADPIRLPLPLLKSITNNFSNDQAIGKGGFSVVYKGKLRNGIVAVKRLSPELDIDEKTFENEVFSLTMVKHKNIVRFLGYCADTQGKVELYKRVRVFADIRQRLLCFEFLPNGGLDKHMDDKSCKIEWGTCYQIIKGICLGLHYLHQQNIVHGDLKPENILLDDDMVPKIADFGQSRCFDEHQTRAITKKVVGTWGYMAPEFIMSNLITLKSDIYSLGIIIIEVLTGQKGLHLQAENILKIWRTRFRISLESTWKEHARVCAEISLKCTDFDYTKRPNMQHIIESLDKLERRALMEKDTTRSCYRPFQASKEISKQEFITTTPEPSHPSQEQTSEVICEQKPAAPLQEQSHQVEMEMDTARSSDQPGQTSKEICKQESFIFQVPSHTAEETAHTMKKLILGNIMSKAASATKVFLHKASKKRQVYFEHHGARMLLRILRIESNVDFTIYDGGDLVKGTRGFHKSNIIGEGAHGTVYKAVLGTKIVAVKRCKQKIDKSQTYEFIRDLVVLCRVNHPNLVRLLGCCLHFEAPMLVYEFMPNGTLGDLLHSRPRRRVTLPTRLRIAAETAEALALLHSPPHLTLHGGIKMQSILLGEGWVAKVSDFGCSTITDNTQAVPKGTLAYLDPEFLQDFQITEKTDVYSFGVVLIELLTGKNPHAKEWKSLTVMFQDRMGNGTLAELLDADIVEEGSMGLIYAAAQLVSRCIAVPGKARPSMIQVAVELRGFSYQMPESPEAQMALKVGRHSYTASTESGTDGNSTFKIYDRGDLVKATRGFHKANIVGEGAHGTVYKATLGTTTVAVKRCKQIDKEFVQELGVLCRVNHPNIVRLLGCCLHFEAPMLVYEFVPNGTLGDLLYGRPRRRVTLPTRLRLAAETAEALAHLHSPPHPTLHGDVKPQNILLGDRWVAKVSDFGCSTINDNVQVVPKGTLAYLDPEFLQDFQITEKTDVYSFGVVLMELLTGKHPQTKEWKNLTVMFQDSMGNGTLGDLLDADIVEEASMGQIYAAAKLVSRCIAVPGKARPSMGQVAEELRGLSDQMPESPEAQVALEVKVDRSYTASTEGGTTGSYSNLAALSTELAP